MLSMKFFNHYLLFIFFVAGSLQGHEGIKLKVKVPCLHAIVVADTSDKSIGEHVKVDLNKAGGW